MQPESKKKVQHFTYNADKVIGNGSFGVVYQAHVKETGDVVAIKKVFQDRRYKNRELEIMKELQHPNVIALRQAFYTSEKEKPEEVFLNLVMEFVPENSYRVMRQYSKMKESVPILYIKIYAYQMCRSLAHTHAVGICHRDIKPQNLLINPSTHILKLCDFGSAKKLIKGEPNVSYICSRYYRAPELIFGCSDYTPQIDVWSLGCVVAEFMLGRPLFPGDNGVDQLVEIIKILGTPSKEQILAMNPNYNHFKFPQIKPYPWSKVFKSKTPPEALDFISKVLLYDPKQRLKPMEALLHPFFDELRYPKTRLLNGMALPELFNFTEEELNSAPHLIEHLIPEWYIKKQQKKQAK